MGETQAILRNLRHLPNGRGIFYTCVVSMTCDILPIEGTITRFLEFLHSITDAKAIEYDNENLFNPLEIQLHPVL